MSYTMEFTRMSHLLLCNKVPQRSGISSNEHSRYLRFCVLGIQRFWLRASPEAPVKLLAGAAFI